VKAGSLDRRLRRAIGEVLDAGIGLQPFMDEVERKMIVAALKLTRGNVTRASRELRVHRNTLHNKIRELGIDIGPHGRRRVGR